jgi:diguanylate cyclase (GGDEF)-like protein
LLKIAQKLRGVARVAAYALAVLAPFAPCSRAQQFSFRAIARGMDNLDVNCIVQDRAGYLWIGTEDGLYRYDGNRFVRFGDAEGLRGRFIQNLFLSAGGTLFVGTRDGIYFQRESGTFEEIHPPGGIRKFSQRAGTNFTEIGSDRVVAVDREGVFLLQRTGPENWAASPMRLEGGPIWSVLEGSDGALWYGCGSDLCRFANGKTIHAGGALHMPEDRWVRLLMTRDGHIWLRGAMHLGELTEGGKRYVAHDFPVRSSAAPYETLAADAQGTIAASLGGSFGLLEANGWRMVTQRNGLTRYDISTLFADRDGSIWIGIVGHGLMRWVGKDGWEAFTVNQGLSDDIVWGSLRDKRGRLWVATESGLDLIPAQSTMPRPWRKDGIQTARSVSLAEDARGGLWVGSAAGELVRIDEATLAGHAWKLPEVFKVVSDGETHRLWIATEGGLYGLDTAAWEGGPVLVEDKAFTQPKMRFTDLCLDQRNHLWAATERGLFRLDNGGWTAIDLGGANTIPEELAADAAGNVWVAGEFAGVIRLRIQGARVVESQPISRPQLLSPQVVTLAVDRRGWLWVGQDAGVTVYNGKGWRSFTQDDGLIWNDTDTNAFTEDQDGSMWIGTSGGLSHLLHPASAPTISPQKPAISYIALGASGITNGARVPWAAKPLTVSIASLNFNDAPHIRFRYRLAGLEEGWVETANEIVRYARLDPGEYQFQVEAVDVAEGKVSPITQIEFRIAPRWWQSWELKAGSLLLAGFGVVMVWGMRFRHVLRQKQQLELAVQHRTEDLEREKAELLRTREQMRHYAEHDDLTGLLNHRIIVERLRGEVDRSQRERTPMSVILADLDYFKTVNDTYGHPSGDLALRKIGSVFQSLVRSYDWVGRYGGEEFLLVLPGTTYASACKRAEQLRKAVQAVQVKFGDEVIQVTVSIGVASGLPADYEDMIRAADGALYRAKNQGRNCVVATEIEAARLESSRNARR